MSDPLVLINSAIERDDLSNMHLLDKNILYRNAPIFLSNCINHDAKKVFKYISEYFDGSKDYDTFNTSDILYRAFFHSDYKEYIAILLERGLDINIEMPGYCGILYVACSMPFYTYKIEYLLTIPDIDVFYEYDDGHILPIDVLNETIKKRDDKDLIKYRDMLQKKMDETTTLVDII